MKKILLCSAVLALCAGQAVAKSGVYIAGKFGGSNGEIRSVETQPRYETSSAVLTEDESTNNVFAWGGAVGYKYDQWLVPLRMEAEYLYRNHYEYDTGFSGVAGSDFDSNVNSRTVLANFYVDVPVTKMFGFFFGAGLGEAINTTHANYSYTSDGSEEGSIDDYAFSWMGTAGITVSPLKWLAFDLSYRYSDLGDIAWRTGDAAGHTTALDTDDFNAQELLLGVRLMIPNMVKKHKHHKPAHTYMDK